MLTATWWWRAWKSARQFRCFRSSARHSSLYVLCNSCKQKHPFIHSGTAAKRNQLNNGPHEKVRSMVFLWHTAGAVLTKVTQRALSANKDRKCFILFNCLLCVCFSQKVENFKSKCMYVRKCHVVFYQYKVHPSASFTSKWNWFVPRKCNLKSSNLFSGLKKAKLLKYIVIITKQLKELEL